MYTYVCTTFSPIFTINAWRTQMCKYFLNMFYGENELFNTLIDLFISS